MESVVILIAMMAIAAVITIAKNHRPTSSKTPSIRPSTLDEFIGQEEARRVLQAMTRRGSLSDHLLLVGPAGTGKTTLAQIAAKGQIFHTAIGSQLQTVKDVQRLLLLGGDILFIDEIHSASRKALEVLYAALEDGIVYRTNGTAFRLPSGWRLIGGTTNSGKLPTPFRNRFGHTIYLGYYTDEEIVQILNRSAGIMGLQLRQEQIRSISRRAQGVPRIANSLLRRVADFMDENGKVNLRTVWSVLGIDTQGLSTLDRQVLEILRDSPRPIGLEQLARRVGVDTTTISESVEPFLLRKGLMDITSAGRIATGEERG